MKIYSLYHWLIVMYYIIFFLDFIAMQKQWKDGKVARAIARWDSLEYKDFYWFVATELKLTWHMPSLHMTVFSPKVFVSDYLFIMVLELFQCNFSIVEIRWKNMHYVLQVFVLSCEPLNPLIAALKPVVDVLFKLYTCTRQSVTHLRLENEQYLSRIFSSLAIDITYLDQLLPQLSREWIEQ